MFESYFLFALCWAICLRSVASGVAPLDSNIQIRNAPATSSSETLWAIRRALSSAAAAKNDTTFEDSTSLDKSWDGAVLFHYTDGAEKGNLSVTASVDIICTTCYIKGTANTQFTIGGGFNFSEAVGNVTSEIATEVKNATETFMDYVGDFAGNLTESVLKGDLDGVEIPPFDVDFDIDLPKLPECNLKFQFDGLELYMEIDTILSGSATYTLNLYTSQTPIGFTVGKDLLVGVVFSIDLIVSVEAEIDISSGFHIQLDGIAIDIHMFDHDVSSITFNGGNFEFLPVKLVGANTVLTAVLRLGIRSGMELGTSTKFIGVVPLDFSTGIEAGVWADVAQFVTNVTATPDSDDCALQVVEEYSMLVGANAGATLALGEHSWGPAPNTQIPIWYTTLVDACAGTKTVAAAAAVTSAAVVERDDDGMTTTVTEITRTAIVCLSTGLINCPASLQSAVVNVATSTLVAAVPVGTEEVAFPTTTDAVVRTMAFGPGAKAMGATSGSPVSYVPTTSTSTSEPTGSGSASTSTDNSILEGKTGGVSNKVIIGVSVGLGVPVLIMIIAGCFYYYRRKRYAPVQMTETVHGGGKSNFGTPGSDNSGFVAAGRG